MSSVKAISFYLPQFHPTAFNDVNWGPGFTEWTNVAQGRPRYPGHFQPRLPGELGFYDLRYRGIFEEQIGLAQANGVHGFCFYYYRFGAQCELDLPMRSLLERPHPVVPFCLCWANESWTRAWDGRSDAVIREQTYGEETLSGLVDDLSVAMADSRYIRIDGKPIFLIYQLEHLPIPQSGWIKELRDRVRTACGIEMLLGAVYSHGFTKELSSMVDLVVQFPPHRVPRKTKRALIDADTMQPYDRDRGDYFESYDAVADAALAGVDLIRNLVPGVCPDWDNSVRREKNAHMLVGSTPEKFEAWVEAAANAALSKSESGDIPYPLLFVNAWNEWAEGAVLEPSWKHKRAYLDAFKRGLARCR